MNLQCRRGGRVLIVEDDRDIRDALKWLLEDEGFDVVCARDGREALTLLREDSRFCVILLDMLMPIMSGVEFRTRQLEDPRLARLPVVVMSSQGKVKLLADGFVEKPFDLEALISTLQRFCRTNRAVSGRSMTGCGCIEATL